MVFLPCRERIAMLCQRADHEGRRTLLGFSRDVGAAERARGVNLRWVRSWCCSMLVSVKRVPSLLPEAKQSIPRWEGECHCTTCDIALHISLHIAFQWWARLDQAEDIPQSAATDGYSGQEQLEQAEKG